MRRLGLWFLVGVLLLVVPSCGIGSEPVEELGLLVKSGPTGVLTNLEIRDCELSLGETVSVEVLGGPWRNPAVLVVAGEAGAAEELLNPEIRSGVVRAKALTGRRTQKKQLKADTKYTVTAVGASGSRRKVGSFVWTGPGQVVTPGHAACG